MGKIHSCQNPSLDAAHAFARQQIYQGVPPASVRSALIQQGYSDELAGMILQEISREKTSDLGRQSPLNFKIILGSLMLLTGIGFIVYSFSIGERVRFLGALVIAGGWLLYDGLSDRF